MATPIKSHIHGFLHSDNGLRDYQKEAKQKIYKAWDEVNNVMFQMPTGTGKTVLFASIINDLFMQHELKGVRQIKILIVAHRDELISQISAHVSKRGLKHGIIQGGTKKNYTLPIQVGSIYTVSHSKREHEIRALDFDYIIIDEAHHATAELYRKLWNYFPESKKLGVTATPCRLDGTSFTDLFQKLILSWSVKKFMAENWLSPYQYYSVAPTAEEKAALASITKFTAGDYDPTELERRFDNMHIRARLYQAYEQYAKGKKGIIYAIKIKHSKNICSDYIAHGVRAVSIDSKMPVTERRRIVDDFKKGEIDVIVNVDIFSEGFDCPDIEFIQLARPTQSLTKYLQQVGRGLRITANKSHCIILDNVGMYERFGFPDTDRKWLYHFNGKSKVEKEQKEGTNNDTRVYTEQDMSEGLEKLELLQDNVRYMQLEDNKPVQEQSPLDFEMPQIDEIGLKAFLQSLNYCVENHAFYCTDGNIYDYHITNDNRIQIFKLVVDTRIITALWNAAIKYCHDSYKKEVTVDDLGVVRVLFMSFIEEYWDGSKHKQVVAVLSKKNGDDYEKLLMDDIDHDDLAALIQKYAVKRKTELDNEIRGFVLLKYREFFSILINCRANGCTVGNFSTISKSSPLGKILLKDLSLEKTRIVYFSDDEIWIVYEDNEGYDVLDKFTRDGRPLGEDLQRSIENETNYQKMFWKQGAADWNNEKYRKQFKNLAPYLYKAHTKTDFSFDLEKGPELVDSTSTIHINEPILPADRIEIGSNHLYAIKTDKGYEVRRKDNQPKWNKKLQIKLNSEAISSRANYYFFIVDFELFALSSESFPYLWKAEESLRSNDIFIVYRPDGKCDYFNQVEKLGLVKCVHYSECNSYQRLYINKNTFLLVGPELEFKKKIQNKFHSNDEYYHDGKPVKIDL